MSIPELVAVDSSNVYRAIHELHLKLDDVTVLIETDRRKRCGKVFDLVSSILVLSRWRT